MKVEGEEMIRRKVEGGGEEMIRRGKWRVRMRDYGRVRIRKRVDYYN